MMPGGLSNLKFDLGSLGKRGERFSVEIQGDLVRLHFSDGIARVPPNRKNHVINGFTRQARMRAMRALARVDWSACEPSLFVTLTYPDDQMCKSYVERRQDRFRFHRYLEKYCGRHIPAVWRCEWEIRKTGTYKGYLCPHWHLMLLTAPFVPKELVREWWRKILHVSGPLCTDVKRITGPKGAAKYLVYYVHASATLDYRTYLNSEFTVGRQWGMTRKALIPMCEKTLVCDLTLDDVEWVKTFARESFPWYGEYGEKGFTMFGRDLAEICEKRFGKGVVMGFIT